MTNDNRLLGVGLAAAAVACLGYASFTNHWLVNSAPHAGLEFGLRDNSVCAEIESPPGAGMPPDHADSCRHSSNSAFVDQLRDEGPTAAQYASGVFAPMGWATLVACLVTAFGLVAATSLALAKRTPDLPMSPSSLALLGVMAGLITGCVFVATKPGPAGFVGVGVSFWVFGAGSVLGIAGAQMLAKVNRPKDPDLLDGAMDPDEY